MSKANHVAAVTAPVASKNQYVFAGDDYSTSTYVLVPNSWKTNTLSVRVVGGTAPWYLVFGDASLATVAAPAKSTVASNVPSPASGSYLIPGDGSIVPVDLENVSDRLKERCALFCPSGASTDLLEVHVSSGSVG